MIRQINQNDSCREIPLRNSIKTVKVSSEDFDCLNIYSWRLGDWGYAESWINGSWNSMHRFLMHPVVSGFEVDHKNSDKLDNRRENLRICTRSQNNANRIKSDGCYSRFKGVTFLKREKHHLAPWSAQIKVNRKKYHLGNYPVEELAAEAYNIAALEHFGEFARLNVIQS